MKNVILWICGASIAVLFSCKKNDKIDPVENQTVNNQASTTAYLKLSDREYTSLINSLNMDLNPVGNVTIDSTIKNQNIVSHPVDFIKIANETNATLGKYPTLKGHNSMLNIYNQALQIKDTLELQKFAQKYSRFITYIREIHHPVLRFRKAQAALLNENGIIQINDTVIIFNENSVFTVKSTDPRLDFKIDSVVNFKILTQARTGMGPRTYGINTNGPYSVFLYKEYSQDTYPYRLPTAQNRNYGLTQAISVFNGRVTNVSALIVGQTVNFDYDFNASGGCSSSNGLNNVYYVSTECYTEHQTGPSIRSMSTSAYFVVQYYNGYAFSGTVNDTYPY